MNNFVIGFMHHFSFMVHSGLQETHYEKTNKDLACPSAFFIRDYRTLSIDQFRYIKIHSLLQSLGNKKKEIILRLNNE